MTGTFHATTAELEERLGAELTDGQLTRLVGLGALEPLADGRFAVTDLLLIESSFLMTSAGVSLDDVLDLVERLRADMLATAERLTRNLYQVVLAGESSQALAHRARRALLDGALSLCREAAAAWFALGMDKALGRLLNDPGAGIEQGPRPAPGSPRGTDI